MSDSPARSERRGDAGIDLLGANWELAPASPDGVAPADLAELDWVGARVPGTVADTLGRDAFGAGGTERDTDDEDWWYRTTFEAARAATGEEIVLRLDGLATVATVYLNGRVILESESMFIAHVIDVGDRLRGHNELAIRFHALSPLLKPKRRPRARWRTKIVPDGNLRFFRTSILGRAPGFAPGPAVVGPWRAISLQRREGFVIDALQLRARLVGDDGVLDVRGRLRALADSEIHSAEVELTGPSGTHRATLGLTDGAQGGFEGRVTVPDVARWWPHTHGDPVMHEVRLHLDLAAGAIAVDAGRVGFRTISSGADPGHEAPVDGLDLHVNDVEIFARGAVWTPLDPLGLTASEAELRTALGDARDAGMNMLRVPGIGAYESDTFHDLCDELGILVWQDFMFANFDYPIGDPTFRSLVQVEANQLLERIGGRPSLAVLCGNSEVEQQIAMLGLDPEIARGELFDELLPALAEAACVDAVYLPSAPSGGVLPFRFDRGVSNYFGVGGYRRPLEDARRSEVRFASECLAISNVPAYDPKPKEGVPRDVGSEWDFEDVRDHYLALLYEIDPASLRESDPNRYLELSRSVSGQVMAYVFGEWRREASPSAGGLVLWMRDLQAGAGWGVVDHEGTPKAAYHHLRRALAPAAVWMTDEGLAGVAVHLVNDGPEPLASRLRLALYRNQEQKVEEVTREIVLAAHGSETLDVEGVIGRFVDASWAYRFGPPPHDLIVATLEREVGGGPELVSQAFQFPAGRPSEVLEASALGLTASMRKDDLGLVLDVRSRRLAHGVRIVGAGIAPEDNAFDVEPGGVRSVRLRPRGPSVEVPAITLRAINLEGAVEVDLVTDS